jgi:uncharacterized protein (DUF488 family)
MARLEKFSTSRWCDAEITVDRHHVRGSSLLGCHRSLIADYLKARGVEVLHILGANKVEPHPYTSAARIVNGKLSYEAESLL